MVSTQPDITADELGTIAARTLVLVGDDDLMTLEHTIALYRAVSNSELAVIPGASHVVVFEKGALLNQLILEFLESGPPQTMLPFRRA